MGIVNRRTQDRIRLNPIFLTLGFGVGVFLTIVTLGQVHWWNVVLLAVLLVIVGAALGIHFDTRRLRRRERPGGTP